MNILWENHKAKTHPTKPYFKAQSEKFYANFKINLTFCYYKNINIFFSVFSENCIWLIGFINNCEQWT